MMRVTHRVVGTLCAVVALGFAGRNVSLAAQSSATGPSCMALLTTAELTPVVGEAMTDMGASERSPGETECAWMLRGGSSGFKTVSLQFYDLRAIAATETAATPAAFFELVVSGAEGVAAGKREALTGIGQQAVFVPTDPQGLAVVQRADGVARIVTNNLTKEQVIAVARAVAAP